MNLGPVGLWTFHLDLQPIPRAQELVAEGWTWWPVAGVSRPLDHGHLLAGCLGPGGRRGRLLAKPGGGAGVDLIGL